MRIIDGKLVGGGFEEVFPGMAQPVKSKYTLKYERAVACMPAECAGKRPYCECGEFFRTAEEWRDGLCKGHSMDAADRARGEL